MTKARERIKKWDLFPDGVDHGDSIFIKQPSVVYVLIVQRNLLVFVRLEAAKGVLLAVEHLRSHFVEAEVQIVIFAGQPLIL